MRNQLTRFVCGGRPCLLPLLFLIWTAPVAWSQGAEPREHFQLKIGASYDEGHFGSSGTTKVLFTPVTLRYLGNRFDVSVTPSFALMNSPGGVRLVDRVPTPIGRPPALIQDTRSGVGDTLVRGRVRLLEEGTTLPALSPFVQVELPTARENLDLGTGKTDYGFGLEVDKQFSPVLLFGDLRYTVIGNVVGLDLQNRVGASFGVGKRLSDSLVLSGLLDWRRSIVRGSENPTELVGVITYRLSRTVTVSPNAYFGLTNSSPDFGGGIELAFRFGSY